MVQNFFRRDLLARVNGSYLGVGWILLQPTFLFVVYYFVFGILFAGQRNANDESAFAYAIYLFSGVIAWQSLIEATTQCCMLIVENGNLVKKVAFPSEALLVHIGGVSILTYLVGAVVCLVVAWSTGIVSPGPLLAALPLVLVVQFLLTLGVGFFLANLYVFVRDVAQLWRILAMAWMFLSPVFWEPKLLEKSFGGGAVEWLAVCNPAYSLLMAHRLALGGRAPFLGEFWSQLGIAAAWAVVAFVVGYCVFMSRKHKYADLI
jgi:ABC-type polysaccharide/polyol phosphate export permease